MSDKQASMLAECPPLEQAVVRLVQDLRWDRLTDDARAGVGRLLRDQLALEIGTSQVPWSRQVLAFALEQQRPGRSRVMASQLTMSAVDAAFVNAIYGHGFEYDDAHRSSASHPGSCVVPTALALGEELGSTLQEVITAMVAGYEVYTRIGKLAMPEILKRGFHPHALLSNFGAAAVTAKLRGFDAETTLHALAIALSHASGTTEYTSTGGSVKRVHAGIGVRNGIRSAGMAKAGITGPRAFLSGNKGLYRTLLQRGPGERAEQHFSLERDFEVGKVWLKPYCCCGCNHAYIDAVRPFAARREEITGVQLRIQPSANVVVGTANANAYEPRNIEHVQYSVPVQVAFALHGKGNGYQVHRDYLDGRLDMAAILATARTVRLVEAPELDERYPGKFVADVTVSLRDGRSEHVFVEDPIGTLENPMPEAAQDAKFMELTSGILGRERATTLLAALRELDPALPASDLTGLCTA
jgi:2-methylcitrate dehydratase PrpD